MAETDDAAELLFFDTFSHEVDADINLDLVQFPKPVYITQVRIIPLGARVQADFPGGVRLGATNPSKFGIEFFVNDLGMPGASTFENLGHLEYNQNDCIHLECTQEKIPTDGLVLRGWYSTITLAVYGILTNTVTELMASPPPPPQPLEPAAPEEVCAVSSSVVSSIQPSTIQPEETPKEAWKEPLTGEVPHIHKSSLSEYVERDDMEYPISTREANTVVFHHSEDERERRLRKASHSSERSASSRNRTHSESNERDYLRSRNERERERVGEKSSRDWSRSPDYSHRSRRKRSERSRSDAEDMAHKWPRTPPASIDSPGRPRSPDGMEYVDNDDGIASSGHFKIKSRPYMRSSESLAMHGSSTTQDASMPNDDDETPGTPGEQFEPILSDDELVGDDDDSNEQPANADEFELEVDAAAANAPPAINEFDPFKMPVQRFMVDARAFYSKELENMLLIFRKFESQTKCESVDAYKSIATSVDERENFVFLSEQLINQLAYMSQHYKKRNFVLKEFFIQDVKNLQQVFHILQISLDFEAACQQPQPAFKIRHIKVGARLMELLGSCTEFIEYVVVQQKFDPFAALFALYSQEFMAMSIKLMLLKAVYSLLNTMIGLQSFLNAKMNGYQWTLEQIQHTPLTRTKCALKSIVKKLNLNESLHCIHEHCTKLFVLSNFNATAESFTLVELSIVQLIDALVGNGLSYQQPRRFLPVSKKFEIVADKNAQRCYTNSLQSYFNSHSLGECLLLLLSNASELPLTLLMSTLNLLQAMLQTQVGLDYLVDDCFDTTQTLVAVLLGIEELPQEMEKAATEPKKEESEEEEVKPIKTELKVEEEGTIKTPPVPNETPTHSNSTPIPDDESKLKTVTAEQDTDKEMVAKQMLMPHKPLLHRMQKLGIEIAYKIQTRFHLDALVYTAASHGDYDAIKLATHLHALYSQTCTVPGRQHTMHVIGSNNNLQIFMDLIKREQRLQAQCQLTSPNTKYKSPVLSYAVDMLDCCVRYCDNVKYLLDYGTKILELAKNHDSFESSVSAVLQEMFIYLRPLEAIKIFAYDDIAPLLEVITRSLDYITTFPGDLIMGLRILRHLAIAKPITTTNTVKVAVTADTEELRHRFVALQFYAADGVQIVMQILEKLYLFFDQPGLHAPALITNQGVYCCQIILPTLQIFREMISFAIQCRDVAFKDVTAVDHLMRTYFLMHYFPADSPAADDTELIKKEIIQILLSYTQPNELDEEFLHKSLWTQMVREVLKNIINGPSTYIPGLQVLAELLPLPLPLPTSVQLDETQTQRLITERKLWSAHLHPQSFQLAKLIETISPTSFPQLADLLTRVCLQLADLAPNMTLLISKTVADLLHAEWTVSSNVATPHLARLLHFFAQLTPYASIKSSALSILSGKLWDLFQAILLTTDLTPQSLKCQMSVHRILESFLDSEISLMSPQCNTNPEVNLASALPPKELIPRIAEAVLANLLRIEFTHEVAAISARNLVILTEHDITFYYLQQQLKLKRSEFQQWLQKLISLLESSSYTTIVETIVLLLRSCMQIEEETQAYEAPIPARTLKMTPNELAQLLSYPENSTETPQQNLLQRLADAVTLHKKDAPESLLTDISNINNQLQTADSTLPAEHDEDSSSPTEPQLPQTEGIVTQYASRPIFSVYESSADETQLCSQFWLDPLRIDNMSEQDFEKQCERITCDLIELASSCLSADTNLSSDCKRLLHLSASPQSNRERTPTANCFRTRRVEVEPSTGRPEKKIYITPVRGRSSFARAPPSRGDLFRSRPPNTSRPPSLHVDDFLALETCGAQPTGPTGYNKIPPLMRGSRVGRNRGSRISSSSIYRKPKPLRTSSPSTWNDGGSQHYRSATLEPISSHFGGGESHYSSGLPPHFVSRPRGRSGRSRSYLR